MDQLPKIILKPGKEEPIRRYHLWIFSGAIQKIIGKVSEGCLVNVFSSDLQWLAMGHYNDGSIAVRIFSFEQRNPDQNFWNENILKAFKYRHQVGLIDNAGTNAYRLVFGEGDRLPGLIIDYFNGTAVIQFHSYGMFLHLQHISEALKYVYGATLKGIYSKCKDTLPDKFTDEIEDGYIFETDQIEDIIIENNCKFYVDWISGQKTGFFIDQRNNRKILSNYCKDKKVLNTFCYSGGFSVYALQVGATLVHSVDSSAKAIELTDKNVLLNGFNAEKHQSFKADVMRFLLDSADSYDIIVLDPPAYAKHMHSKHKAIQAYKRLNENALRKINAGGFLFTFSCSQVVDASLFKSTVIAAAIQSKRKVRIVEQLFQPPDHPVNAFHPESEYLKGLLLFVE